MNSAAYSPSRSAPRPRRRWPRLSVRALLALVLLAAVALGWLTHSIRGRNRALAEFVAAGGKLYHADPPLMLPGEPWTARARRGVRDRLIAWFGPGAADDVEAAACEGPATAADLAHLAWFAHLKKLTLEDTNQIGAGWRYLRGHPELTELVLRRYPERSEPATAGPGVDDAALAEVARVRSLTALKLHEPTATGPGYAALADLPLLEELSLFGGGPDDAAAARLLAGLPALRMLSLHPGHASGRSATLEALARHHPDLDFLGLSRAELTAADFRTLARLTRLTALHLSDVAPPGPGGADLGRLIELTALSLGGPGITDADLRALGDLAALESLDVSRSAVTDAGLPALGRLPLVYLDLNRTGITDAGMATLGRIATLERLALSGLPGLTDAGLIPLRRLTGLKTLVVNGCPGITRAGIAALKLALPSLRQVYSSLPSDPDPDPEAQP